MKTLPVFLLALLPLTSFADDASNSYAHVGDTFEFARDVVFANPSKYTDGDADVLGSAVKFAANGHLICWMNVSVAANSKATVRAGRKMLVTKADSALELEAGVSIRCRVREELGAWEEMEYASMSDVKHILRSLPMLRFARKAPPAPNDKEL